MQKFWLSQPARGFSTSAWYKIQDPTWTSRHVTRTFSWLSSIFSIENNMTSSSTNIKGHTHDQLGLVTALSGQGAIFPPARGNNQDLDGDKDFDDGNDHDDDGDGEGYHMSRISSLAKQLRHSRHLLWQPCHGAREHGKRQSCWVKAVNGSNAMVAITGVSILRYINISILIKYSNLSRFYKKTGSIL